MSIIVIPKILIMAQRNGKIFTMYPGMQGIGQVLDTLYGVSDVKCAMICMHAKSCTSYNMMNHGHHCQLLAAMTGVTDNDKSNVHGKNHLQFTVF